MAIRVSDCAHAHTTDIDPELKLDSKEWDRMANVCVSRATTAMSRDAPGYSELQRHQIEDIFNSMMATHRTIRRVLDAADAIEPETVDVLALVRLQLEGLYSVCLMLEDPKYVDHYMQDHWRKQYVGYLIIREETRALPRWAEFHMSVDEMRRLVILRGVLGVSAAQQFTVDFEELGTPIPSGFAAEKIPRFPTPATAIKCIKAGNRRAMLERLYLKYVELCSFSHGLGQANLMKIMFDKRSPYHPHLSESEISERYRHDIVSEAYTMSLMGIAQSTAELISIYPGDLEILEAAHKAWTQLAVAHLLTKAVWEIRTRKLLGVI